MFTRKTLALSLILAASLCATTLEQLSMDDMIQQSSGIVRAKVTGTYTATRGAAVWTFYRLQTLETLKSSGHALPEVAVPGGSVGGVRQTVAGSPSMSVGQEYVVFVWISRSGLPQVIGLSQGLFSVTQDGVVSRAAATERMLNQQGRPVDDQPTGIKLADLRSRIQAFAPPAAGAQK